MSAKERRDHLERAIAEGGVIMTAKGSLTRTVPSTATLARTPEEKRAAREDLERRARALEEEARALGMFGGNDEDGETALSGEMGRDLTGGHEKTVPEETGDELPEDFPGRKALVEAGYTTLSSVRELSEDEVTNIQGIGPATAQKIQEALAE